MRIPLMDAFDVNIMIYLNMLSYVNHKNNEIDRMMREK